jgi:hypothetical protein
MKKNILIISAVAVIAIIFVISIYYSSIKSISATFKTLTIKEIDGNLKMSMGLNMSNSSALKITVKDFKACLVNDNGKEIAEKNRVADEPLILREEFFWSKKKPTGRVLKNEKCMFEDLYIPGQVKRDILYELSELSGKSVKDIKDEIVNSILHDITKINGYCLQELYGLIPEDAVRQKSYKKQILTLEKHIVQNKNNVAKGLFRVNRDVTRLKTECSNLKSLFSKSFKTDKKLHNIGKAMRPSLHVYMPLLSEKGVEVRFNDENAIDIAINFEYFDSALSPFFDNLVKYILPNSELTINFLETKNCDVKVVTFSDIYSDDPKVSRVLRKNNIIVRFFC